MRLRPRITSFSLSLSPLILIAITFPGALVVARDMIPKCEGREEVPVGRGRSGVAVGALAARSIMTRARTLAHLGFRTALWQHNLRPRVRLRRPPCTVKRLDMQFGKYGHTTAVQILKVRLSVIVIVVRPRGRGAVRQYVTL